MKQKESKFEIKFWRWVVRLLALGFCGLFFAAGCMAVYVGINDPLNLDQNADLGIYEAAPLGLLFMTIGILPLYYAFRPVLFWEDYLEPAT
ncbi:MAG: hypothetical protein AB8H12_12120 [Lewinella sp.]